MSDEKPFLRVVRGNPDDAELAALAVVLASVGSAAGSGSPGTSVEVGRPGAAAAGAASSGRRGLAGFGLSALTLSPPAPVPTAAAVCPRGGAA